MAMNGIYYNKYTKYTIRDQQLVTLMIYNLTHAINLFGFVNYVCFFSEEVGAFSIA